MKRIALAIVASLLTLSGAAHGEELRRTLNVKWEDQPRKAGQVMLKRAEVGQIVLVFFRHHGEAGTTDTLRITNHLTGQDCVAFASASDPYVSLLCGNADGMLDLTRTDTALEVEWVWEAKQEPAPAPATPPKKKTKASAPKPAPKPVEPVGC